MDSERLGQQTELPRPCPLRVHQSALPSGRGRLSPTSSSPAPPPRAILLKLFRAVFDVNSRRTRAFVLGLARTLAYPEPDSADEATALQPARKAHGTALLCKDSEPRL